MDAELAAEVAAMQFAGGMTVAQVAESWEQDAQWVEQAVRRELLKYIPRRDGGLKPTRTEMRAERQGNEPTEPLQAELRW